MRLGLPLRILPLCIQLLRAFLYMRILRSPFAQLPTAWESACAESARP